MTLWIAVLTPLLTVVLGWLVLASGQTALTDEDVAALVALYRPGPMAANMHNDYADRKNGRKPVEFLHPDAAEILGDTYGLMIYQESMMRVAQKFAGYSLADADNLRKACGKKIREVMAEQKEKFVTGCERTGYGTDIGPQWLTLEHPGSPFANGLELIGGPSLDHGTGGAKVEAHDSRKKSPLDRVREGASQPAGTREG